VDGISLWVNEYLGLKGEKRLSKAEVGRIARWVHDQYEKGGRITAVSDDELLEACKEYLPKYFK
jgi:hypothetical protein